MFNKRKYLLKDTQHSQFLRECWFFIATKLKENLPSYTKPTVKCWLFFTYFLSFVQTKSIILLLMVVYIEYVILDNLTFDFLILFCTNKITKSNAKIWQLILGALLGTATAIALPYVGGGVLLYLYKTASLVVMNLPLGSKYGTREILNILKISYTAPKIIPKNAALIKSEYA